MYLDREIQSETERNKNVRRHEARSSRQLIKHVKQAVVVEKKRWKKFHCKRESFFHTRKCLTLAEPMFFIFFFFPFLFLFVLTIWKIQMNILSATCMFLKMKK